MGEGTSVSEKMRGEEDEKLKEGWGSWRGEGEEKWSIVEGRGIGETRGEGEGKGKTRGKEYERRESGEEGDGGGGGNVVGGRGGG